MRYLLALLALALPIAAAAVPPLPVVSSSHLKEPAAQTQPVCSAGRVAYQSTASGSYDAFTELLPFGSTTPHLLYGGAYLRGLDVSQDTVVAAYDLTNSNVNYQKFWRWHPSMYAGNEWYPGDEHTVGVNRVWFEPGSAIGDNTRLVALEMIKKDEGVAWKILWRRWEQQQYTDEWPGNQAPGVDLVDPEVFAKRLAWAEKVNPSPAGFMVKVADESDFSTVYDIGVGRHPALDEWKDVLAYESWDGGTPMIGVSFENHAPQVLPGLPGTCAAYRFPRLGLGGRAVIYAGIDCDVGRQALYFTNLESGNTFLVDVLPAEIRDAHNPPYDLDADGNLVYSKWVGGIDDHDLFHVLVDFGATY